MSFQFIHVESYARVAGKGKAGGLTIKKIADEADRVPGNFPHVDHPKKPIIRFGVSANKAAKMAEKWAEVTKDPLGRKIRADGLCLLAGVISYPNESQNWDDFRDNSVDWLKNKYGRCLKSVIEHTDESHRHIHFYCVPENLMPFHTIHEGRAAADKAKNDGKAKGVQNAAYIEQMRAFQDQFSNEVAMKDGLLRMGPAKRRLTRAEWHREKKQAQFFANASAQHKLVRRKAKKQGYEEGLLQAQKKIEEEAKAFSHVGRVVGNFAKGLLADIHAPTQKTKKRADEAEAKILEIEAQKTKKIKEVEDKERNKAKLLVQQMQKEIDRLQRIVDNTNIESNKILPGVSPELIKKTKLKS